MTTTDVTPDVQVGLSLEDYILRLGQEGAFEIINGREIAHMPNLAGHQDVIGALFFLLKAYMAQRGIQGKAITEAPFVIATTSNWVKGSRIPDVMLIGESRWLPYTESVPEWRVKPLLIVPDLAVEIVTSNDLYSDVMGKAAVMLSDGVAAVWIIDPFRESAQVMTADGGQMIDKHGSLATGDFLPGFSATLAELLA